MKYDVISAEDHAKLVTKVNEAITKGWKPQGGIALLNLHQARPQPASVLCQAVIKED